MSQDGQDVYAYWRAVGKGRPSAETVDLVLPTLGATIPGENPQAGLWKVRPRKGEGLTLMQIWLSADPTNGVPAEHKWREGLMLFARVGKGTNGDAYNIAERWLFVQHCSQEHAAHWRQHGTWPDDAPALAKPSNLPSDPFEALLAEWDQRLEQARGHLNRKITTHDECNLAANLADEIDKLRARAEAMFKTEKHHWLEGGRAVDNKFRFRESMAEVKGRLVAHFGDWMAAEERRLQAERNAEHARQLAAHKAEEERLAAERAAKMRDEPVLAHTDPAPAYRPPPAPPPPVKVTAGGATAAKAGLATVYSFEVTDRQAATVHFMDDPTVRDAVGRAIQRIANATKGTAKVPGVTFHSSRKAKT